MSQQDAYRNWSKNYSQQQAPGRLVSYLRSPFCAQPSVYSRQPPVGLLSTPIYVPRKSPPNLAGTPTITRPPSEKNREETARRQATPIVGNRGDHRRNDGQRSILSSQSEKDVLRRLFLQQGIDISNAAKLGAGRYSKVVAAKQMEGDSGAYKKIAIKVINTEKVTADFREKFLPREIDCWRQLSHPNLVRILGHYEAMKYVFLSMEFGEGGDLLGYVQKNGAVPEAQTRIWLRQMVSGVSYMHSCGIAHRDLKLENCILFADGNIKVADFGFAVKVAGSLSKTYCGSKSYSAPEILMGRPYSPFKADVWSLGVIGFVMVTDTMPFRENMHNYKIVESQKRRDYRYPAKLSLSTPLTLTLDEMLTFDQTQRPSLLGCLQLPFFTIEALHHSKRCY